MIMYRATGKSTSLVPVECPVPKWPNYDADGFKIFDNTHFASAEEAWEQLQAEADAGVRLGCSAVEYARDALAEAERELVDRTLRAEAIRQARKDAERSTSGTL